MTSIEDIDDLLNKIPTLAGKVKYLENVIVKEKDKKLKKQLVKLH